MEALAVEETFHRPVYLQANMAIAPPKKNSI